ncbi:hypothetical protein ACFVTJ_01135 [Agrobacterium sp. NPDC058088]|uniref:hypothetical protein n=1 Tax=Agrobacterium sp. NPDC058088 TaxID=3346335 RepID=UPI0036DC557E
MAADITADSLLGRFLQRTLNQVIEEEVVGKTGFVSQHLRSIQGLLFVYLTRGTTTWSEISDSVFLHDSSSLLSVSKVLEKTGDSLINVFFTIGPPLANDQDIWDIVNRTTAARYRLLPHILAQVSES